MPNYGGAAKGAASGAAAGSMFGPWGTGIGAGVGGLMGLFGSNGKDRAVVPPDMQKMREQNIALLMSLLSPGAFDGGGAGSNFFYGAGGDKAGAFANGMSPEMSTYNTMRPILEGMMTGTGPQFERDIGMANSTGGRFGSGNAIMRGEALRNLFNGRQQTASTLGTLAGQAGSSQFDRLMGVQNQRMQLLAGLMGMSGQASLSAPVEAAEQPFGNWGDIMKLLAVAGNAKGGGGGNGSGGWVGRA